jgi:Caspase domain
VTFFKKVCVFVIPLLAIVPTATALAVPPPRYAVVIGSNFGDTSVPALRYAEDDAQKVAQTLRTLGGFPADQVIVMTGASASNVRDTIIRLNARLREASDDAVLFVYYSGHADGESLQLAGTHLDLHELGGLLQGSAAATRVLVLDACRSGSMTRVKGGVPGKSFDVVFDAQPLPKGLAILTSSAATEDSQESDSIKGSYFSHFFVSGLLGAADANADGSVGISEAFEFASHETSIATQYTKAGPQHPTFRVNWGGRQDLVLTRPRPTEGSQGGMQFVDAGRYVVKKKDRLSGVSSPVAEIAARSGGTLIALQPGEYEVVRRGPDYILEGDLTVKRGEVARLSSQDMHRYGYAIGVRKGGPVGIARSLVASGGVAKDNVVSDRGWQGVASYREDRRRFSTELRIGYGRTSNLNEGVLVLDSHRTRASALILRPWDLSFLTVALGLEVGAVMLSQDARPTLNYDAPRLSQDQLPSTRTFGLVGGPLLQVDVPFRAQAYLRLEFSAPFEALKVSNQRERSEKTSFYFAPQALIGVGIYL